MAHLSKAADMNVGAEVVVRELKQQRPAYLIFNFEFINNEDSTSLSCHQHLGRKKTNV